MSLLLDVLPYIREHTVGHLSLYFCEIGLMTFDDELNNLGNTWGFSSVYLFGLQKIARASILIYIDTQATFIMIWCTKGSNNYDRLNFGSLPRLIPHFCHTRTKHLNCNNIIKRCHPTYFSFFADMLCKKIELECYKTILVLKQGVLRGLDLPSWVVRVFLGKIKDLFT